MDKVLFLISAFLLVWGLRLQSDPASASKGNKYASVGMLIAIISSIIMPIESLFRFDWIYNCQENRDDINATDGINI